LAILNDSLSVWTIAHRWGGYDPDTFRLFLPLSVKDNFRVLMGALLDGEMLCETLTLAKRPADSIAGPEYYLRTYIDDIYACIFGDKYNRKLFKWAVISRDEFKNWCEARTIALPEFWFPPGWQYETPDFKSAAMWAVHLEPDYPGSYHIRYEIPDEYQTNSSEFDEDKIPERASAQIKLACQQIASVIWRDDSSLPIPEVVQHEMIQKYGGAMRFQPKTVAGWLKSIAPRTAIRTPGRPSKKKL
jgi:hypothetical protein